jgi:K+-sensing histidine kinase KdpD
MPLLERTLRLLEWALRLWSRIAPIVVPFLIIAAVTRCLYLLKIDVGAHHLVFFYLLPTAFIAMLYGSVMSMICAIDVTFVAAIFLYDPEFSVYVSDPRAVGELFFFVLTALIGAKCTAELTRQIEKPFSEEASFTNKLLSTY